MTNREQEWGTYQEETALAKQTYLDAEAAARKIYLDTAELAWKTYLDTEAAARRMYLDTRKPAWKNYQKASRVTKQAGKEATK